MSSESLIEQIGAPISGGNPAGVDTRIDRSFNRIKDARNEASRIEKRANEDLTDQTKSQKDMVTRGQSLPHWKTVVDLGCQALATRTKDLDIASYVIEATVRTEGFAGLADAFRWTRLMVDGVWGQIYPVPDADEGVEVTLAQTIEDRIQPISRLSGGESEGLLVEPLSWIEITNGRDYGPYCFWQYRQALEYEKCSESEQEVRRGRGTVTLEQFTTAVNQTSDADYQDQIKAISDCKVEYGLLIASITKKIDEAEAQLSELMESLPEDEAKRVETELRNFPRISSSRLGEEFEKCLATLRHITKGRFSEEVAVAADPSSPVSDATPARGVGTTTAVAGNGLQTREDAFRALAVIATFFERTEPQSLIPAQIKKIIRLGKLSPAEFFTAILDNSDVRDQLFKIYGLELKNDGD